MHAHVTMEVTTVQILYESEEMMVRSIMRRARKTLMVSLDRELVSFVEDTGKKIRIHSGCVASVVCLFA